MSAACSFCDRSTDNIVMLLLISSPGPNPKAYICDDCVLTAGELIVNRARTRKSEVIQAIADLRSVAANYDALGKASEDKIVTQEQGATAAKQ